eukprot:5719258-Pleurochrysis_carterae.AAC.6
MDNEQIPQRNAFVDLANMWPMVGRLSIPANFWLVPYKDDAGQHSPFKMQSQELYRQTQLKDGLHNVHSQPIIIQQPVTHLFAGVRGAAATPSAVLQHRIDAKRGMSHESVSPGKSGPRNRKLFVDPTHPKPSQSLASCLSVQFAVNHLL